MTRNSSGYIGCHHKRFIRLRILSEFPYQGDLNEPEKREEKEKVQCVAAEESKLWSNGHVINYSFVKKDKSGLQALPYPPPVASPHENDTRFVMQAMNEYEKYANVKFARVDNPGDAAIRICFVDEELWSTIGTDALMISGTEATTNLPFIKNPAQKTEQLEKEEETNLAIALHAIGHVLGLFHEMDASNPSRTDYARQKIDQHFSGAHDNRAMSNFNKVQPSSIMRYFVYKTDGSDPNPDLNKVLSDDDKAWLAFHYPKPEFPGHVDAETWGFQRALGQLLRVPSPYYERIVKSGDVFERRSLYLEFLHSEWSKAPLPLSDTTMDETLRGKANAAIYCTNNSGRLSHLVRYGDPVAQKLQAQTARQAAPTRMPDGDEPNPVEIQQSIGDFLRLLGFSAAPEVQHFLTHKPDDEQEKSTSTSVNVRKAELEVQISREKAEVEQRKEVKKEETALNDARKAVQEAKEKGAEEHSREVENEKAVFQRLIAKTVELERKKDQIKVLEQRLRDQEEQEKREQFQVRVAQAGLEELVRHVEHSIQGSDVTGADIQQFITWIPALLQGAKVLTTVLGFSVNIDGTVQRPEEAQEGITDWFRGAFEKVRGLPVKDMVDVGQKIFKAVTK